MFVDPRVAGVSDHQQVETLLASEFDDGLHFVSAHHPRPQIDSSQCRTPFALGRELVEVAVLRFDLVAHLVDGFPVMNRPLFDADHVQRGSENLGQIEGCVEGLLRAFGAIVRHQDLLNHGFGFDRWMRIISTSLIAIRPLSIISSTAGRSRAMFSAESTILTTIGRACGSMWDLCTSAVSPYPSSAR